MKGLVIRNLKLYFKDKGAVFFSLLGVLIVIGLYILFLGDTFTDGLKGFYKPEWLDNGRATCYYITNHNNGCILYNDTRQREKDFQRLLLCTYQQKCFITWLHSQLSNNRLTDDITCIRYCYYLSCN